MTFGNFSSGNLSLENKDKKKKKKIRMYITTYQHIYAEPV